MNVRTASIYEQLVPDSVWIRLGIAYSLLGLIALLVAMTAGPADWWLHGLWCFAGLVVALPTLARIFRQSFTLVITEHRLMFLASFCLYFLYGASLLAIGPQNQAQASLMYYPIDAQAALRVDSVNGLGFGLAMLSSGLSRGRWFGNQAARVAIPGAQLPAFAVIGLFLLLGAIASTYVVSSDLGLRQGLVSGTVRAAGNFSLVSIFLAVAHKGRGEAILRAFGILLAIVLAAVGALLFNKSASLLPIAAMVAGMAIRFGSIRVLPLGLTILVGGFMVLGAPVSNARNATGENEAPTLAARWQALKNGWDDAANEVTGSEYYLWSRLCYTPPQAAALDFQDSGQGGDGFKTIPWIFVPRLLASQKPEISKTGQEFHRKITGYDNSSTGQGIFASGYYHAGWIGLCLASMLCGWILAQTSAIARKIQENGALILLPFSLLGVNMAFRIDGDFIVDYLAVFIFFLYPLLATVPFFPKTLTVSPTPLKEIT